MSRTALPMSRTNGVSPRGCARRMASSSGEGGFSGVDSTEIRTEPIEQTAPRKNEPNTQ
jgi:hypothetical protein